VEDARATVRSSTAPDARTSDTSALLADDGAPDLQDVAGLDEMLQLRVHHLLEAGEAAKPALRQEQPGRLIARSPESGNPA